MPKPRYRSITLVQEPQGTSKGIYYQVYDYLHIQMQRETHSFDEVCQAVADTFEITLHNAFNILEAMNDAGYVNIT